MAILAATAAPADRSAVPSSHQLEAVHRASKAGLAGHQAMKRAIPVGTPVTHAVAGLSNAGAKCKPSRNNANATKCLLHHFDLTEGFADNVRWSVTLQSDAGEVSDVVVERELVRHGI